MVKREEWTVKKPDKAVIKKAQPKAAKPGLSVLGDRYRAGMHLELLKFGRTKTGQLQLLLDTGLSIPEAEMALSVKGLDSLSLSQSKALTAVQILLDRVGYRGINVREEYSQAYKAFYTISELPVTWSDYFEAYGIKGKGTGRTKQEQEAVEALESLAMPRRINYRREGHWTGKGKDRKRIPAVTIFEQKPLLDLAPIYVGLTEEEEALWRETGQKPAGKRSQGVIITVRPLLLDGIEDFYTLKPTDLHPQIQALSDRRRISHSLPLFCEWLFTLDKPVIKISYEKLAEKLNLYRLIETRQKKRLFKMLEDCYEVAKSLGILLDYQVDGTGTVTLHLNPDECYRVRAKQLRGQKALPVQS